jgi:hypothetical protein
MTTSPIPKERAMKPANRDTTEAEKLAPQTIRGQAMQPIKDDPDAPERNGIPCWLWHRLWKCGPQIGFYDPAQEWWKIVDGSLDQNGDISREAWWGCGVFPSHWSALGNLPVEHHVQGWGHVTPTPIAEHLIPAGMKPWHGGDAAPEDWDGGPVWLAGDEMCAPDADDPFDWAHEGGELGCLECWCIVAYTPKAAALSPPAGMMREEVIEECARAIEAFSERNQHMPDAWHSGVQDAANELDALAHAAATKDEALSDVGGGK